MGLSITKRGVSSHRRGRGNKINWQSIKNEWVSLKANGSAISLREFSKRHGTRYEYMRIMSSKNKWAAAVEDRIKDIEKRVSDQLIERSADAITSVRQALASDESEVRERHAKMSKEMQRKAISRLREIPPEQLTAREAIDLLRISMEQERRALGIPDEQRLEVKGHLTVSREQEIFEQHLLVHQNVQTAVGEALKLLEDKSNASQH
jgi:hypothetical protein